MANKHNHRRFGWVRKLPSGRYQASYLGPDGQRRYAPETFQSKTSAGVWLTAIEADMLRGDWLDPDLGKITLQDYGERWIKERKLGVRTREEYERQFRLHIKPFLGEKEIGRISAETVRSWRQDLLEHGRSEDTVAKAYRKLRAIMNTAVDDERIKKNPCRIKGADKEHPAERPVASVQQVFLLAQAIKPRYTGLVLAAAFTGLRWGELIGLRRSDVDLEAGKVRVTRRLAQLSSGQLVSGPTKSEAGVRKVTIPALILPDLRTHVDTYVKPEPDALLFTGEKGAGLRRGNWHRSVKWKKTVANVGLPAGFTFHDLRHTGNTLAAASGASTRELMHRMGHGSVRAALIYQHATDERDQEIADTLSKRAEAQRPEDS